jgi:tetratricopeptide (TPR) repeat protein
MRRFSRGLAAASVAAVLFCVTVDARAAADEHYKRGYTLWKEKKFSEAVSELTKSTEMSGKDYNFFMVLADAYRQMGRWGDMVQPLQKATALDATKHDAFMLLGFAHLKKEPPDFNSAGRAFAQGSKLKAGDFQFNYYEGYSYFRAKDYPKALVPLETAVSLKGSDYNAVYNLGATYIQLGQCDKAAASLEKAAQLQPKKEENVVGLLMSCYSAAGENDKAVAYAQRSLESDPKDVVALTFVAQSQMAAKKWPEAIAAYEKLSAAKPKDGEPHFLIGQIHVLNKDYPAAIESFEKALALQNKCEWRTALGSLYQTQAVEIDSSIGEVLQADPDATPDATRLDEMMALYTKARDQYNNAVKACKSDDARQGLAAIKDRVSAWTKYSEEAAALEDEEDDED